MVKELTNFRGILRDSLAWHQGQLGKPSKRKTRKELSKNPHPLYASPEALHLLNNIYLGVETLINSLNVYDGPYAIPKEETDSDTPNQIFNAALGFVEANPEKSIQILSYGDDVNEMLHRYIARVIIRTIQRPKPEPESLPIVSQP